METSVCRISKYPIKWKSSFPGLRGHKTCFISWMSPDRLCIKTLNWGTVIPPLQRGLHRGGSVIYAELWVNISFGFIKRWQKNLPLVHPGCDTAKCKDKNYVWNESIHSDGQCAKASGTLYINNTPSPQVCCSVLWVDFSSSTDTDPPPPPHCDSRLALSSEVTSSSEGNGNIHSRSLSPWSWRSVWHWER